MATPERVKELLRSRANEIDRKVAELEAASIVSAETLRLEFAPFTRDPEMTDLRNEPTDPYPIFDTLPRLWAAGYVTKEQDGEWNLFAPDGEGVLCGKDFRSLCVNIVLAGL